MISVFRQKPHNWMRNLIICIQLLIGHHYIIVYDTYIITYQIYDGEAEVKQNLSFYNYKSGVITKFDDMGNKLSSFQLENPDRDNLIVISSDLIQSDYKYLDYTGEKYRAAYNFEGTSTNIVVERVLCELPIVDKYLGVWKDSTSISLIKPLNSFSELYSVEVYEVTHCKNPEDLANRILISRLESIEESYSLDSDIQIHLGLLLSK